MERMTSVPVMAHEEDTYSTLFSVLKHPIRRRILRMLHDKPHTYTEILSALNVETGFLNYHLDSMRGIVKKNEGGRYGLSVFGEAAVGLISRVEEPSKREGRAVGVAGFRLTYKRLLTAALAVLLASNVYSFSSYLGLYRERTNALGEIVIQTRALLSEANSILNHTLANGKVDFDVWQVMLKDFALQLRLYSTVAELDPDHRQQWGQIRFAVDEALTLFLHIDQKYESASVRYLNLTGSQISSLRSLLDGLLVIETKAFPRIIYAGFIPRTEFDEEGLARAVEAAFKIQTGVQTARMEFDLQV